MSILGSTPILPGTPFISQLNSICIFKNNSFSSKQFLFLYCLYVCIFIKAHTLLVILGESVTDVTPISPAETSSWFHFHLLQSFLPLSYCLSCALVQIPIILTWTIAISFFICLPALSQSQTSYSLLWDYLYWRSYLVKSFLSSKNFNSHSKVDTPHSSARKEAQDWGLSLVPDSFLGFFPITFFQEIGSTTKPNTTSFWTPVSVFISFHTLLLPHLLMN